MDAIEKALRRYVAISRSHRYGGLGTDLSLALKALEAYKQQRADLKAVAEPAQLPLFGWGRQKTTGRKQ